MYITDGCNITVPRGDRADIPFVFTDRDTGDTVIFPDSTRITLDVFPVRGEESAISKTLTGFDQFPDGTLLFSLMPEDTDIPFGGYFYTLTARGSRDCDTLAGVPEEARFEIR